MRGQPYTLANVFLAGALLCHVRSRLALAEERSFAALCWSVDAVVLFAAATLSKAAALPSLVRVRRRLPDQAVGKIFVVPAGLCQCRFRMAIKAYRAEIARNSLPGQSRIYCRSKQFYCRTGRQHNCFPSALERATGGNTVRLGLCV
jgi:hypothetical protein